MHKNLLGVYLHFVTFGLSKVKGSLKVTNEISVVLLTHVYMYY